MAIKNNNYDTDTDSEVEASVSWVSHDESSMRSTAALVNSHASELDEFLPRPEFVWKWTDVVDRDLDGEGLTPSVAWRLYDGFIVETGRRGWFRVTDDLWAYLRDRYSMTGRAIGVKTLAAPDGGFESRVLCDSQNTTTRGRQVSLNGDDAEETISDLKREEKMKSLKEAAKKERVKHEIAERDDRQLTIVDAARRLDTDRDDEDDDGASVQARLTEIEFKASESPRRSHDIEHAA